MALGLSFGKKKQSTDLTRTSDVTQNQSQTATTDQQQQQVQNSVTNALNNTQTSADSRSQQGGTAATRTSGTQSQTGRTQTFSDTVLSALESAGMGALGRTSNAGRVDTGALGGFDMGQFISDAVNQASAAAGQARGIAAGGMNDALGGTARGNTMAALLDQQLAIQESGAIAGARNDATAQAMDIIRQNLGTEMAATGQDQGFMTQLLGLLQGGQQVTTGETATAQTQASEDQRIASEMSNQQQLAMQQQQSQAVTELTSLIAQLVRGTTNTVGTEREQGTTRQSGGGFSLSL